MALFWYTVLIPEPLLPHRAIVDQSGNIILPDASSVFTKGNDDAHLDIPQTYDASLSNNDETGKTAQTVETSSYDPWLSTDFDQAITDPRPLVREHLFSILHDWKDEGARQLVTSMQDGRNLGSDAVRESTSAFASMWRFLSQPVWIPNRNRQPKQYSRGTLFLLDTVRFGGTFALLFGALFGALNYQSFITIAQSYIDPLTSITAPETISGDTLHMSQRKNSVSVHTTDAHSYAILNVLPAVGPPENRMVIPRLDLNVPIVIPPRDALLAEDWKQLEAQIQDSLQNGVVHYPGTAEPGQPGNFFITGHSSYFPWAPGSFKSVFARLHELNVGDEYWIYYGGDRFRYVIREKKEIRPSDVSVLDQPVGKRIGTLMTCTPVGTTLRRLIIVAQEVDPVTGEDLKVGEHQQRDMTPKLRMDLLPI